MSLDSKLCLGKYLEYQNVLKIETPFGLQTLAGYFCFGRDGGREYAVGWGVARVDGLPQVSTESWTTATNILSELRLVEAGGNVLSCLTSTSYPWFDTAILSDTLSDPPPELMLPNVGAFRASRRSKFGSPTKLDTVLSQQDFLNRRCLLS